MRTRLLVALVAAVGCGPKEKTVTKPDAPDDEFADAPIIVFPDAPIRADARFPDARPPDGKPSLPDAKMNPDAPMVPDAPPATPDAPIPDAMPTGGLRPWPGETTHVRVLDLQLLTPDKGTRVCIFGTDADARPYAVLSGTSHDLADSYQLATAYDLTVPAGIPLKIYVHDWAGGVPDTSTTGCATGASQSIGSLLPDHYYSLARNVNFVDDCGTNDAFPTECAWFPADNTSFPSVSCAPSATYLIDDGDAFTFGWRVVNMTSNAAVVGFVPSSDNWTDVISIEKDATTGTTSAYASSVDTATKLTVCPAYLYWCLAPDVISNDTALADMASCTGGTETTWRLQQTITSRIADSSKTTTFYVVGDPKALSADMKSLIDPENGFGVTIVIAVDNLSD